MLILNSFTNESYYFLLFIKFYVIVNKLKYPTYFFKYFFHSFRSEQP